MSGEDFSYFDSSCLTKSTESVLSLYSVCCVDIFVWKQICLVLESRCFVYGSNFMCQYFSCFGLSFWWWFVHIHRPVLSNWWTRTANWGSCWVNFDVNLISLTLQGFSSVMQYRKLNVVFICFYIYQFICSKDTQKIDVLQFARRLKLEFFNKFYILVTLRYWTVI